jgi:hypothetical protein
MKLLTKEIEKLLRKQSSETAETKRAKHKPFLKLFVPWGAATWLISELDEDGRLYGLCDLGMGEPELGYVMLSELESIRGPAGLKIERDLHWTPQYTLSEYAQAARNAGRIVEHWGNH